MQTDDLQRFAELALSAIDREYPYHLSHTFLEPGEVPSPRAVTPVFYGCYDWHSAVHGHWLLARAVRLLPPSAFVDQCREALDRSLVPSSLLQERDYLAARPAFERPYGLAWVLALAMELREHHDNQTWQEAVQPVEAVAAANLANWLPKLSHPIRCGTHPQTAFAMALTWDWAEACGHENTTSMLRNRANTFFGDDRDYPLHLEPSGEDFFSPSLGAASMMARVLDRDEFMPWMEQCLPTLGRHVDLEPVSSRDRQDGRLAHLDGLNLSRAWMLCDIAVALGNEDSRFSKLIQSAQTHAERGLEAVSPQYYAGSHWLGTFAAYLSDRMSRAV